MHNERKCSLKMSTSLFQKLLIGQKAIKELGSYKVALFFIYHLLLKLNYFHFRCPANKPDKPSIEFLNQFNPILDLFPFSVPTKNELQTCIGRKSIQLLETADEIVDGNWRYFGGELHKLDFSPKQNDLHWSDFHDQPESDEDYKFIWESARFCWVYPLGSAFILTGDEKYFHAFFNNYANFLDKNPPNLGPNWISAQEVALRIIALCFAYQVFHSSAGFMDHHKGKILGSIYQHAARIPATLSYAKAQNNNHLISEAVGLIIAGSVLKGLPESNRYSKLGWKLFVEAIDKQIFNDGSYVQQSTNYHRMMLQLSILAVQTGKKAGFTLPVSTTKKLRLATQWLFGMMDEISGLTPNLGHNDGSNILPLAQAAYQDYRPTIQCASLCFFNQPALNPGVWDELGLWLGFIKNQNSKPAAGNYHLHQFEMPPSRIGNNNGWGIIRAVTFQDRPAHADQLSVDLWWHGHNIALDPGTYRYTAPAPWNNSLSNTPVHNTITINDKNQMLKAGRFLWLDWAQAKITKKDPTEWTVIAEHNGYKKAGVKHQRQLSMIDDSIWEIRDELLPFHPMSEEFQITLQWLLPDGAWHLDSPNLAIDTDIFRLKLSIEIAANSTDLNDQPGSNIQIIRCGEILFGKDQSLPNFGWFSPTYGFKTPAISFRYILNSKSAISIISRLHIMAPVQDHNRIV